MNIHTITAEVGTNPITIETGKPDTRYTALAWIEGRSAVAGGEMRPVRPTAVHKTEQLAELVCSNSFRGDKLDNAVGLLKEEMRRLGSLVMRAADASRVPAGAALAAAHPHR